jgi:hypothetical protein
MLMIEVLMSPADRKTRLLAASVEALDRAGTDPNDYMVFLEISIAPVAPSAAVGSRHQSQASNDAMIAVAALRTTVVRTPKVFKGDNSSVRQSTGCVGHSEWSTAVATDVEAGIIPLSL